MAQGVICPYCKHITTLKRPMCLFCGSIIPKKYIIEFLNSNLASKAQYDPNSYPFVDYQLDEDYIEEFW